MQQDVKKYLLSLQESLCGQIQSYDRDTLIQTDEWQRPQGGGGITRVLRHGKVFDSAGVNFSHVMGENLPPSATNHRPELAGCKFEAMGVSSVMHPVNPYVPTCHMNVRFFIAFKENSTPIWWFGGGFDLTPYYPFHEDVVHWHQEAKNACSPFGDNIYPEYKAWADKYFYLPHRQETRGVGGLFFDDLNTQTFGWDFAKSFNFLQSVGNHFWKAYGPLLAKRHPTPFSQAEVAFQRYRRGRYVEFNLVYDRGTLFGLQSGGRTESILMSLPPFVTFEYQWAPEPGSKEAILYERYLQPQDWLI